MASYATHMGLARVMEDLAQVMAFDQVQRIEALQAMTPLLWQASVNFMHSGGGMCVVGLCGLTVGCRRAWRDAVTRARVVNRYELLAEDVAKRAREEAAYLRQSARWWGGHGHDRTTPAEFDFTLLHWAQGREEAEAAYLAALLEVIKAMVDEHPGSEAVDQAVVGLLAQDVALTWWGLPARARLASIDFHLGCCVARFSDCEQCDLLWTQESDHLAALRRIYREWPHA
jgi:hypothetical protein